MCVLHMLFQHLKNLLVHHYVFLFSLFMNSCGFGSYWNIYIDMVFKMYIMQFCMHLTVHTFQDSIELLPALKAVVFGRIWPTSISLGHIMKRCDLKSSQWQQKVMEPVSRSFPKMILWYMVFEFFSYSQLWLIILISSSFSSLIVHDWFAWWFRVFVHIIFSCFFSIKVALMESRKAWHVSKFSALVGGPTQQMGFLVHKIAGGATWKVVCGWIPYFGGGWTSFLLGVHEGRIDDKGDVWPSIAARKNKNMFLLYKLSFPNKINKTTMY